MKILYVNHDGGGFAEKRDIPDGQTVGKFFSGEMPDASAGDYLIRVNRQPATAEQALVEGDRVTVTPVKIEGASGDGADDSKDAEDEASDDDDLDEDDEDEDDEEEGEED